MDKVAIVILHYKNENDTVECLNSLLKDNSRKIVSKIIVVCNQTSSNFILQLEKKYSQIETIKNQENLGFAQGNNLGIKKAFIFGCDYIILLNNDTLSGPKLAEKLVNFVKTDTSIGLVSPKIYFAHGFEYHRNHYHQDEKGKVIWYAGGLIDWSNVYASHRGVDEVDKGQYDQVVETDFVTGCCMLIKRKLIEEIGYLDPNLFLYFEDVDYSLRAKRAGYKTIYYPYASLWHKNASSSGAPGSIVHQYYQTRNRLYFGYKYASFRTKKSLAIESINLFLKGGIKATAVKDYYFVKMGKGSI